MVRRKLFTFFDNAKGTSILSAYHSAWSMQSILESFASYLRNSLPLSTNNECYSETWGRGRWFFVVAHDDGIPPQRYKSFCRCMLSARSSQAMGDWINKCYHLSAFKLPIVTHFIGCITYLLLRDNVEIICVS